MPTRFTVSEDIALVEALHHQVNSYSSSHGFRWAELSQQISKVHGINHDGGHIRNQLQRVTSHLYDSNAPALVNAFRRVRTVSLIRSGLFAASMPNNAYPDDFDVSKFKEKVQHAAKKLPELKIDMSKYKLPDVFTRTKKTPSDVKEWLQESLDDEAERPKVLVSEEYSRKGVGMSFQKAPASAEADGEQGVGVDLTEECDDSTPAGFCGKKFEEEDVEVGGEDEQKWVAERGAALVSMFKLVDNVTSMSPLSTSCVLRFAIS